MSKEIVYSGDPLCAWCFGFTDIYSLIRENYKEKVRFSMVMGGLRVESSIKVDSTVKTLIQRNLITVSQRTGQTFSTDKINDLPDGEYNSEPPCRAVVTVRLIDPELEFPYYKALHYAFYRDMKNITDPVCMCAEAKKLGISPSAFHGVFESDETREMTRKDFDLSRKAGVLGYPALILKDKDGLKVLNQGYKPLEHLTKAIDGWLEGRPAHLFL